MINEYLIQVTSNKAYIMNYNPENIVGQYFNKHKKLVPILDDFKTWMMHVDIDPLENSNNSTYYYCTEDNLQEMCAYIISKLDVDEFDYDYLED